MGMTPSGLEDPSAALRAREKNDGFLHTPWQKDLQPTHRHVKTGGLYRILYLATIESDLSHAVVYMGGDGIVWVRPEAEFFDGRFEKLDEPRGLSAAEAPTSDEGVDN